MASRRRDVLLRIVGDGSEARREVKRTRDEVRQFARERAEVSLQVRAEGVEASIERAKQRIRSLQEQADKGVDVRVQLGRAFVALDRLEARLAKISGQEVNIDVDVRRGAIERTAAGLGFLERRVAGVTRGFGDALRGIPLVGRLIASALEGAVNTGRVLGQVIGGALTSLLETGGAVGKLFGSVGSLGGPIGAAAGAAVSLAAGVALLGAVAGGVVIVVNALVGAIIAFGAALVAVVASLTAAAGALGALAVAFAGVLGPAIIVLIGLFQRFSAILEARKAREQALASATQDQKAAEDAAKTATEQRAQAEQDLAEATVQGRRAMRDAIEEQGDAERGLQGARLGLRESRLSLRDARAELRDFLKAAGTVGPTLNSLTKKFTDIDFDPSAGGKALGSATGKGVSGDKARQLERLILNVQRAQLNVKDAVDAVGDAERRLGDARQRNNEFTRRGIRAYAPYRAALERVKKAEERLTEAQAKSSQAMDNYREKLSKLSGTERGVLQRVNELAGAWTALAKAFTDPIFRAMIEVFDSLKGGGDLLKRSLTQVGEAFGDVIRALGGFLREKATRSAFKEMASGAAFLARQLGARAFVSFLRIMRDIARAALPAVRRGAKFVADALDRIAGKTRDVGTLRARIEGLVRHFTSWARLGWSVLRAVGAIFRVAAPGGKSLADSLRKIVDRFTAWANSREGQARLRRFFRDMINRAKDIVRWIARAAKWLSENLPEAAADAKKAFNDMKPAIQAIAKVASGIYHTFKLLVDLLKGDLKAAMDDLGKTGLGRKAAENLSPTGMGLKVLRGLLGGAGFQHGGPIPGSGPKPIMAHGGEFVLKQAAASKYGGAFLSGLNAGLVPAPAGAGAGGGERTWNLNVHPVVPGGGRADERTLAAILDRELRRIGG